MKKNNKTKPQINISMAADLGLISQDEASERILQLVIQAPEAAEQKERPCLNLGLVLDRSGSMGGDKLSYVKKAAVHLLDMLDERDKAAMVIYDDRVDVLSAGLQMTTQNRETIKQAIHPVRSRGSTNLSGGWLTGCEQVAKEAQENSINHTLLLTDGLANVDITDPDILAKHAYELAQRRVTTSTFGVGRDYNQYLLEAIANKGGGHYYYIETPSDIPGIFSREFQELAKVTAQDVEIVVDLPAECKAQVVGDWNTEYNGKQLRIKLGNLYSARKQQVYLKLDLSPTKEKSEMSIRALVRGKSESGDLLEAETALTFRCASKQEVEKAQPNHDVQEGYSMVELAQTAKKALKMERDGKRENAYRIMQESIRARTPYIDPAQSAEYQRMSERMKQGMGEVDRKQSHYRTYLDSKFRPEWREYHLSRPDNHLVINVDGRKILIDTGSPISFGREAEWYFLGHRYELSPEYMGVTIDYLSRMIGTRLDLLLGMDILNKYYFLVDAVQKNIVALSSVPISSEGIRFPFSEFMGIPIVQCQVANTDVEMYFDTGAKLTYLKSELINRYPKIGDAKDFYPGIGEFDTPVFELPITFAGTPLTLQGGILPKLLEDAVAVTGAVGILGTEVFNHFRIEFAFRHREIFLEKYR